MYNRTLASAYTVVRLLGPYMLKNSIIAIQSLLLALGIAWYVSYKHEILQTFQIASLGFIANETRLMARINDRLERGEVEDSKRILREIIAGNTKHMEETVDTLDLTRPARLADAERYAALVENAGITQVSELIRRRAAEQSEPN
jgi:hypothetical protein